MTETLQHEEMAGLPDRQALSDVLSGLAAFDVSLAERISTLQAGYSPNGQNPNGLLSEALDSDNPTEQQKFIDEYHWALALVVYSYRNNETKETLMAAAEDSLFVAGETYDPTNEPNFLTHLSTTVNSNLTELFGPASEAIPFSADQLETLVSTISTHSTPPRLANERTAKDFTVGQRVLLLVGARLVEATVQRAEAYSSPLTLGPPQPIPPKQLEERQRLAERRKQELIEEGFQPGIMPDPELLRLNILLRPEFQTVIPNPSPGFVRLQTASDRCGLITDMDRNTIIPMDAWQWIKRDGSYREAWLTNGSKESLRKRDSLLQAIHARVLEEAVGTKEFGTSGRARPRQRTADRPRAVIR